MISKIIIGIFTFILYILLGIGYIRCCIKFFTSDFNPISKREIVYGIGTFTGFGVIIGYFDIKD